MIHMCPPIMNALSTEFSESSVTSMSGGGGNNDVRETVSAERVLLFQQIQ